MWADVLPAGDNPAVGYYIKAVSPAQLGTYTQMRSSALDIEWMEVPKLTNTLVFR